MLKHVQDSVPCSGLLFHHAFWHNSKMLSDMAQSDISVFLLIPCPNLLPIEKEDSFIRHPLQRFAPQKSNMSIPKISMFNPGPVTFSSRPHHFGALLPAVVSFQFWCPKKPSLPGNGIHTCLSIWVSTWRKTHPPDSPRRFLEIRVVFFCNLCPAMAQQKTGSSDTPRIFYPKISILIGETKAFKQLHRDLRLYSQLNYSSSNGKIPFLTRATFPACYLFMNMPEGCLFISLSEKKSSGLLRLTYGC